MFAPASRKPASLRNAAIFAAMPLLASGPALSCKCDRREPPPAVEAPAPQYQPPPRADSAYKTGYIIGCPLWMVRAADQNHEYCIDRFEAHLSENVGGKEATHPSSVPPAKFGRYTAKSAPGVRPQSSVSRKQAEDACFNAGKRLCTLGEWMSACQGVQLFTYPYGNVWRKDVCNTHKEHVISRLFGKDWGKHMVDAPETNMIKGYLAKTGEYSGCASSFGAYDMVGNLQEWVSTPVDARLAGSRPRIGPAVNNGFRVVPGNGIFVGGFYGTSSQNGNGCFYWTMVHGPQQNDYSIGFRCCTETDK
ncbi:formylglycine-generating enzyme family protein [Candidatus Micrarchaeota archaeon]|nr:formylglycine-generating enzyme family protein [Candidatus Micrarchaeota archaeon]